MADKILQYGLAEDEFSEDESMDFLASASSVSKPRKRSTSSAGNEKRKLMGTAAATLTTMDHQDGGVFGSVIGRSAEPEKEPLHFDKNLFEEETWHYLAPLINQANSILWHWKTFPISLPSPIETKIEPEHGNMSTMRKKTLNLQDLFVEPNFDETKSIGMDAKGRLKRLTPEQLSSVRKRGEIEADSIGFAGQKHKWAVTQLLIKGNNKTHETMLNNLADSIYLLAGLSRDLIEEMFESVNGWSVGLMNLLQMVLGTPLIDISGLEKRLQLERSKYLVADLKEAFDDDTDQEETEGKVAVLCRYILHKEDGKAEGKVPPIPYRFVTPQGMNIDLRLCNKELMSSVKPHLLHILNTAILDWIPERRKELMKQCRQQGITDDEEMSYELEQTIKEEYFERIIKLIYSDQGIDRIGGKDGLAELLVSQAMTAKIINDVRAEEERLQIKHRQKEEKTLQSNYPILSRINSWLKRNLNKAVANYVKENQWRPHQEAISRCKKAHLEQSAYFLTKDLSFRKDQEPILNKEMKHLCQSPAKNATFKTRIWHPQNWIVTEQCHGESVIIPTEIDRNTGDDTLSYIPHHKRSSLRDQEKGITKSSKFFTEEDSINVTYCVSKYTERNNDSGYLGWRWVNFFYRTNSWFWNILFILAIVIPWCSPFSFRALLNTEPFYPDYVLDTKSGVIKKDRNSRTKTIKSKIDSLWNHVRQKRKDFESQPDTGLLPKTASRHIHRFVNYFIKGFIGTLIILLVLPLTMVLVSTGSIFLAMTSPIYVWIGSALFHFLCFLFFDIEGDSPIIAVVWNVCMNFIGIGFLKPVACALMAFIICPVGALLGCILSVLRKGLRDAYDSVIFQLLIKPLGRMPVVDSFAAKRVAGPGMASNYYYQITTEQALAALETAMDLDRLLAYHNDMMKQIRKPEDEYKRFITMHFGPFGVSGGSHEKLQKETSALLTQLEDKVEKRKQILAKKLPNRLRNRIRLAENDLKLVLHQGTLMVEKFYISQIVCKMTSQELSRFWSAKNIKPEDWLGLTSNLFSDLFSPEFLIPLQEIDSTFQLKVQHWNLSRYLNMALDGNWKDDLDVTRVMQAPKVKNFVTQPDIPLESFNPIAYKLPSDQRKPLHEWLLYKKRKPDLSMKLVNPLPLPHPIGISVIISNRDEFNRSHIKLDKLFSQSVQKLIEESPSAFDLSTISSPTSIHLVDPRNQSNTNNQNAADRDSTIRDDDCASMAEMDPAMASLTQSLEELDKEVDRDLNAFEITTTNNRNKSRLSLGGGGGQFSPAKQNNPALGLTTRASGPGSVPLLASDEDLSSASQLKSSSGAGGSVPLKKFVNRDSYSTVV